MKATNNVWIDFTLGWFHWVVAVSIQVSLLAALVWLLDRLLRQRVWPQLRAALWALVMVKLLVPPDLSWPLSIASLRPQMSQWLEPTLSGEMAIRISTIAFVIWALGFLAFVVLSLSTYARERRRLLFTDPLGLPQTVQADLNATLTRASRRIGVATPSIQVSSSACSPSVIGLWRPVVVLPLSCLLEGRHLEHILLHELAHIKRRDPLAGWLCWSVLALFWFHPVAWLAYLSLGQHRELACDHRVKQVLGSQAPAYRQTLLCMAQRWVHHHPVGILGFIARRHSLIERIVWLDRPLPWSPARRRLATLSTVAVLAVFCIPLASSRLMPAILTFETQPIEHLEGCMQKRFAVLQEVARQQAADSSITQP